MDKNKQFVITINRELGSGGHTVGRILAERLQVKYYDKALIDGLTEKFGLSIDEIERIKAQEKESWWDEFNNYYKKLLSSFAPDEFKANPTTAAMFESERCILQGLAEKESCVVAGRSGFLIFREWKNHLNVFIQASMAKRIERLMGKGMTTAAAIDTIQEVDAGRETYIQKYSDKSRYDTRNYDLVISMDNLTEDDAVDLIMEFINRTSKK